MCDAQQCRELTFIIFPDPDNNIVLPALQDGLVYQAKLRIMKPGANNQCGAGSNTELSQWSAEVIAATPAGNLQASSYFGRE